MSLKERLMTEVKTAMKAKEKARLGTLRLVMAAIKQIEVDERIELDDERVMQVLEVMVKQRRDSVEQFSKAGRQDLVDVEEAELKIISEFMPQPLSEDEIHALIVSAIAETKAESMRDMGKVMGIIKAKTSGSDDMGVIGKLVKAKLG